MIKRKMKKGMKNITPSQVAHLSGVLSWNCLGYCYVPNHNQLGHTHTFTNPSLFNNWCAPFYFTVLHLLSRILL